MQQFQFLLTLMGRKVLLLLRNVISHHVQTFRNLDVIGVRF